LRSAILDPFDILEFQPSEQLLSRRPAINPAFFADERSGICHGYGEVARFNKGPVCLRERLFVETLKLPGASLSTAIYLIYLYEAAFGVVPETANGFDDAASGVWRTLKENYTYQQSHTHTRSCVSNPGDRGRLASAANTLLGVSAACIANTWPVRGHRSKSRR
jgi:hypothetical protein